MNTSHAWIRNITLQGNKFRFSYGTTFKFLLSIETHYVILCNYYFYHLWKEFPPIRMFREFPNEVNDSMKRLRDSRNSIMWKKSLWEGSMIAEIPLCERKVVRRLCDSRNSIIWKEKFLKGSMIAEILSCERKVHERLRDSWNSIWKRNREKALW
jgi:hypothetical protein